MSEPYPLKPGDIVRSRRGKDEGQLHAVLSIVDERYALVADGGKRRFDRPKRKNMLHLEPLGFHSEEVANSLRETGRVTNAKLRFAIQSAEAALGLREPRHTDDAKSAERSDNRNATCERRTFGCTGAEEKGE